MMIMNLDLGTAITQLSSGVTSTITNSLPDPIKSALSLSTASSRDSGYGILPEYALCISCTDLGINFKAPLPPEFDWGTVAEYEAPFRELIGSSLSNLPSMLGPAVQGLARIQGAQLVTQALTAKFWAGSSSGELTFPVVLQAQNDEVEEVLKPLIDLMSLTMPRLQGGKQGSILEAPGPHLDLQKAYATAKAALNAVNTKSVAGQTSSTSSTSDSIFGTIKQVTNYASNINVSDVVSQSVDALHAVGTAADSFIRSATRNIVSVSVGRFMVFPSMVIKGVSQRHSVQPVVDQNGNPTGNMQRCELNIVMEPFTDLTMNDMASIFQDKRAQEYVKERISRANAASSK